MKKIRLFLYAFLLTLVCTSVAQAQGKTHIFILGKDKGTVSSMQASGHILVDARATAKKLGGTVEFFSASKQLKVAFPGMYAILGAHLKEAIINAKTIALPAEIISSGGKIYAPVEFFMLPQVQSALDRQITFENNALVVEKHYQLEFIAADKSAEYDILRLAYKDGVTFAATQPNAHTVKVTFPNVILKRDISERPKDNFIRSFSLQQRGKDVLLEVILGAKGKAWRTSQTKQEITLHLSAKTLPAEDVSGNPAAEVPALEPSVLTPIEEPEPEINTKEPEEPAPVVAGQPIITAAPPQTVLKPGIPTVITTNPKVRIMIDPGHGGKDPGAVRRGSAREKDLNLTVAKHLYNYLKKQGFDVKLTRDNDTFVTLAGRSKMANDYKADLFVSVHTNAAKRAQANGFEVYFRSEKPTDKDAADIAAFENEALQYEEAHYSFVDKLLQSLATNEYMNESSKLASHVRNYVYKEPGISIAVNQNNAVKQANFYVLRGVQSPAILVEMGYISSSKDRARLNNKSAQKHMGEGIGKGVVAYLKAEGKIR